MDAGASPDPFQARPLTAVAPATDTLQQLQLQIQLAERQAELQRAKTECARAEADREKYRLELEQLRYNGGGGARGIASQHPLSSFPSGSSTDRLHELVTGNPWFEDRQQHLAAVRRFLIRMQCNPIDSDHFFFTGGDQRPDPGVHGWDHVQVHPQDRLR